MFMIFYLLFTVFCFSHTFCLPSPHRTCILFCFVLFFFATRTNNKRTNHSLRTSLHIWSGDIMERLRCAAAGVSPLFGCLVSCVVVVVVVVALFFFFLLWSNASATARCGAAERVWAFLVVSNIAWAQVLTEMLAEVSAARSDSIKWANNIYEFFKYVWLYCTYLQVVVY